VLIGGKVAVVAGYGDVGKGCADGAPRPGRAGDRHRDRPDLRAAGGHGRLPGNQPWRTSSGIADIFVSCTGNYNIITAEHMAQMKHQAIVSNIGHFDNEIDMAGLTRVPRHREDQHQATGRRVGVRGRATPSSSSPRAA